MDQQPDKFFRDKLDDYRKQAPVHAWRRISENLAGRKRAFFLRTAAAIALLLATGVVLYPVLKDDRGNDLTKDHEAGQNTNAIAQPLAPDNPPNNEEDPGVDARNGRANTQDPGKQVVPEKTFPHRPEKTSEVALASSGPQPIIDADTSAVKNLLQSEADADTAILPGPPIAHQSAKKVTIIFTAEEVNERYLSKNTHRNATAEEKKTSAMKKLLEEAYDLKTNQDLFGVLRQKKNEILAINFKNEKQNTEND